ncbi:43678_t:CDS:2, partial [Gigaspora margarita]
LQASSVLHNQNIAYNTTYPSNESANRLQASSVLHNQNSYCSNQNPSNNSEHRPVMARNLVTSEEQQYSNLFQSTTMSIDDIPYSYSSTSYDVTGNQNYDKESHTSYSPANSHNTDTWESDNISRELTFSDEKSLVNWLCTRPDLIIQAQNSLTSSSYKAEISNQKLTDKEIITNLVMEQCKLLFLRTRNPTKKIRETLIKKVALSMDS